MAINRSVFTGTGTEPRQAQCRRGGELRIALLLTASLLAGCTGHYKTATVGFSTGEPTTESLVVKHWANASLESPYGNSNWYGTLCSPDMNVYCDASGGWVVRNVIANHDVPQDYSMRIDFGHQDNNDPKTFRLIASFIVPAIHCAAHETKTLQAAGAADPNILAHFSEINAVRPIFVREKTQTTLGGGDGILWISRQW